MLRKLLVVFASAMVLAVISICLAWVAGGQELRDRIHNEDLSWNVGGHDGPSSTRSFDIAGGETLVVEMPVDLSFTRGEELKMIVEGPQEAVDALTFIDGRLAISGRKALIDDGIEVTIVAPSLSGLVLEAPGDVELKDLRQDSFTLSSLGAADVEASGVVRKLDLKADGAADLDFEKVEARDARVRMNGAADIDIAATGDVDIAISGVGSVTLHRKPARLNSRIDGIGSIDHDY